MRDRFQNFKELRAVYKQGADFNITYMYRSNSPILVMAPHGGQIEPATSELTKKIAGKDYSYYSFEGVDPAKDEELHITSHRFDEPQAENILKKSKLVLGVHGRLNPNPKTIYLGGRDIIFIELLDQYLQESGFLTKKSGHMYPGKKKENVCNRGQLEFSRPMRDAFLKSAEYLEKASNAVRLAIKERLDHF